MVVNDPTDQQDTADSYKRDFWIKENLKHAEPHYRLRKTARLINRIAAAKQCELLDLGCRPR